MGFFVGEVDAVFFFCFDEETLVAVFLEVETAFAQEVEVAVHRAFGGIQKRGELLNGFVRFFLEVSLNNITSQVLPPRIIQQFFSQMI